jgi:hypothetical protein
MTEPTETPFSVELEAASLGGLPAPQEFQRVFKLGIERAYNAERAKLGDGDHVDVAESLDLHRTLAKGFELAKGYKAAFEAGRKLFDELQAELLADGVGEQDGVPNQDLLIPDPEGDITLKVGSSNVHTIELESLKAAVAAHVIGRDEPDREGTVLTGSLATFIRDLVNGDTAEDPERLEGILAESLMQAMDVLMECGSFEAQVSKVRAFGVQVQRDGNDPLGAQVLATITTRRKLDGVTMSRKTTPRSRR